MMEEPLVTIIVTAYNYAHMLPTTLDSALAQTYGNIEILLLDNASTDDTGDVVAPYLHDKRVRYVRNAKNIGSIPNHRKGLDLAKGEYIVFLSADDLLMPDHLRSSIGYLLSHPEIDVVYSGIYHIDGAGNFLWRRQEWGEPIAAYDGGRNEFAAMLAEGCYMQTLTVVTKRATYETYGKPGDPELVDDFTAWDYELYTRWSAQGVQFAQTDKTVAALRMHPDSVTSYNNYVPNGNETRDYLKMLERFVTPENAKRLDGYENTIARALENRRSRAETYAPADMSDLNARSHAMRNQLFSILQTNRARAFEPRTTIFVIAHPKQPLFFVERSLRSIVAQTHADWEAFVVHQPASSIAPMCRYIDPRGRIKAVSLMQETGPGQALNAALRIAGGNAFAFLHAGNTFEPDYLAQAVHALRDNDLDAAFASPRLFVGGADGVFYPTPQAFPYPWTLDALSVAPMTSLDALVCRRSAFDRVFAFSESASTGLFEWDLFVRLRALERVGAVNAAVNHVSTAGVFDRILHDDFLIRDASAVYALMPTDDPILTQQRAAYYRGVQHAMIRRPELLQSAEGIVTMYQAISGHALWSAAALQVAA